MKVKIEFSALGVPYFTCGCENEACCKKHRREIAKRLEELFVVSEFQPHEEVVAGDKSSYYYDTLNIFGEKGSINE